MNKNTTKFGFFFLLYTPLADAPRFGYRSTKGGNFTLHNFYILNRAILWHKQSKPATKQNPANDWFFDRFGKA